MPLIDRISEELSEARSVMTGRMVDSYTNIQTLKTFADDDDEDAYVADSVIDHVGVFRRLMRGLHLHVVDPVPAQRLPRRLGHLDRARRLERRHA